MIDLSTVKHYVCQGSEYTVQDSILFWAKRKEKKEKLTKKILALKWQIPLMLLWMCFGRTFTFSSARHLKNFLKLEGVKKNALSTFLVDLQRQILEISKNRTDRFFQNWPKYEEQFLVKRQKENEWMCQIKNDLVECFCLKPKKRKEVGKGESMFY